MADEHIYFVNSSVEAERTVYVTDNQLMADKTVYEASSMFG